MNCNFSSKAKDSPLGFSGGTSLFNFGLSGLESSSFPPIHSFNGPRTVDSDSPATLATMRRTIPKKVRLIVRDPSEKKNFESQIDIKDGADRPRPPSLERPKSVEGDEVHRDRDVEIVLPVSRSESWDSNCSSNSLSDSDATVVNGPGEHQTVKHAIAPPMPSPSIHLSPSLTSIPSSPSSLTTVVQGNLMESRLVSSSKDINMGQESRCEVEDDIPDSKPVESSIESSTTDHNPISVDPKRGSIPSLVSKNIAFTCSI